MKLFDSHFASLKLGADTFKRHSNCQCLLSWSGTYFPFHSHASKIECNGRNKRFFYQRCCWNDTQDCVILATLSIVYVNAQNMSQINHSVFVFFSTFFYELFYFRYNFNGYPHGILSLVTKRNACFHGMKSWVFFFNEKRNREEKHVLKFKILLWNKSSSEENCRWKF